MSEDQSPESLQRFLESDDPALVLMGLSMAKGVGIDESLLGRVLFFALFAEEDEIRTSAEHTFEHCAGEELQGLVAILRDPGEDIKARLAEMGEQATKLAIETLVESLGCDAAKVRESAVAALVRIGEHTVQPLSEAVIHDSAHVRKSAAEALAQVARVDELDPFISLIMALKDDATMAEAAEALSATRDRRATGPLIDAFSNHRYEEGEGHLAKALGRLGNTNAVEPLINAVGMADRYPNLECIRALGKLDDSRAAEALIPFADDEYYVLAQTVAQDSLMEIASTVTEPVSIEDLTDYGYAWSKILVKIGSARAVLPLIEAMEATEADLTYARAVYAAAISQLGFTADAHAAERLLNVLHEIHEYTDDPDDLGAIAGALCTIVDSRSVELLTGVLEGADSLLHAAAADALGCIEDIEAVEPLLVALEHENGVVRRRAAVSLGKIGDAHAVAPLLEALEDAGGELRAEAAVALGQIGDVRAVEPLLAILADLESGIQAEAAVALGQIGDARAVEPLSAILADAKSGIRAEAAVALGQIGDARAVEPLSATLADAKSGIQAEAAVSLGQIGDVRAVEPLLAILADAESDIKTQAAVTLGQIGDARAVEPLLEALKNEDDHIQAAAAEALGRIGDPRAIEALITLLGQWYWVKAPHENWSTEDNAANALRKFGATAAESLLLALADGDNAAGVLADVADIHVLGPLVKAAPKRLRLLLRSHHAGLQLIGLALAEDMGIDESLFGRVLFLCVYSPEEEIRKRAAHVFERYAQDDAYELGPLLLLLLVGQNRCLERSEQSSKFGVDFLIESLRCDQAGRDAEDAGVWFLWKTNDPHPLKSDLVEGDDLDYCANAIAALSTFGEVGIELLIARLRDEDWRIREQAARALGQLRSSAAVKPLLQILGHEDEETAVHQKIVESLGMIGDEHAVAPLIDALRDDDIRIIAADILGKLADSAAVEPLVGVLGNANEETSFRQQAALSLGKLGGAGTVDSLIAALGDDDREVRKSAAEALGEIGDTRATEPLIRLLADEDEQREDGGKWVCQTAATALGKIGGTRATEYLIEVLENGKGSIRSEAATALGWTNDGRAVDTLIQVLQNDDDWHSLHHEAIEALGRLGDPRAKEALEKLSVSDYGWFTVHAIADAVKKLDHDADQ